MAKLQSNITFLRNSWVAAALAAGFVYVVNGVLQDANHLWLLASMGPTIALMTYLPDSRMSTSKSIVLGHCLSALVGVSCAQFIPFTGVAGPVALAGSLWLMSLADCEHPPGTATSLIAVLGGNEVAALGYGFVIVPVLTNVMALLAFTTLYWRIVGARVRDPVSAPLGTAEQWLSKPKSEENT